MKRILLTLSILFFTLIILKNSLGTENQKPVADSNNQITVDTEIDEVFSLLAYAIVYKYWTEDDRNGRGYNVGSILISPKNEVLGWGINSVNQSKNCTQHGEVRLMTGYLDRTDTYSLDNHTIYSTLEPCAMCAGMMTMASVKRTVNGQRDYHFSKALERLAFDSEAHGGYPPYPRIVISQDTPSRFGQELDKADKRYIEQGNKPILTKFLSTSQAKEFFEQASKTFLSFSVKKPSHQIIYQRARSFFDALPDHPNS